MRYFVLVLLFITSTFAKLSVVVSIPPQKFILKEIVKERVSSIVVVTSGNSPHTYEPKPSQMVAISKAKLYFAIGVEFERVWLPKFKSQNSSLDIVYLDKNITKLKISEHSKVEDDPHIWLNIDNLKQISINMTNALIKFDSNNSTFYKENLDKFLKKLDKTDSKIRDILKDVKSKEFLIFHPSWGYFAKEYGLKQIAVEIEGKEPTPKELVKILKLAKRYKVKVIFVQPEFSKKSANLIAKELGIKVVEISPLKSNVLYNMLYFAKALKGK